MRRHIWLPLVAVCLLVSIATTAYAECAWVLWESHSGGGGGGWQPVTAYGQQNACRNQMTRERNETVKLYAYGLDLPGMSDGEIGIAVGHDPMARNANVFLWRCLPDSVDPRGPKER